jgi:hypothetical protein
MIYKLMEPTFEVKDYRQMNKKEAQQYFDWFMNQIPDRLNMLKEAFEFTGGGRKESLNFTEESLKELWAWFVPRIESVNKTKEELEQEATRTVSWLKDKIKDKKFSFGTMALIMDISIYVAEVFVRSYSQIRWGMITSPKSFVSVNRPILLGFINKKDMDCLRIVNVLALKSETDKNTEVLFNLFQKWKEFL